jgi:hypothetical protein
MEPPTDPMEPPMDPLGPPPMELPMDPLWNPLWNPLLNCTLDAKMPSFEFWVDFRRSLMYIIKRIGEKILVVVLFGGNSGMMCHPYFIDFIAELVACALDGLQES